ncbi:hypothetical protein [Streptomyces sp. NBC_01803]|uniref:hypothetical protein n=1 Tax=Streptomyces sp. NBC_01803 TaxID=2975946 RepID=UPI002DDBCBA8|nr:hypothetical protein [Streptomyces sp. NBC_01803]WSA45928.1 hypothetical protein OIE51_18015 [Streptomyces sp. NBC_01803]
MPVGNVAALHDAIGKLNPILRTALETRAGGNTPTVIAGYDRLTFSRSRNPENPPM